MRVRLKRMLPRVLLVNPPVYDFAAYDFWLKPYGILSIGGYLRGRTEIELFDCLDRTHPFNASKKDLQSDGWGRGKFYCEKIASPGPLVDIPRLFRRFGLPRRMFVDFLKKSSFDFVLVQTMMTYWYLGVEEIIEDVRALQPDAGIILGGNYVSLCGEHAGRLDADLIVKDRDLEPLWRFLSIEPDLSAPGFWKGYKNPESGILRLSDGCPFKCSYCCVPAIYGKFQARPLERSLEELRLLSKLGVQNIAFYDDALLFEADKVLMPFLEDVLREGIKVNFHTPNGLNARFITQEIAQIMVRSGFKSFYIGFESLSEKWQKETGSKVCSDELARAVENLTAAGARPSSITAYQLLGHPDIKTQQLERTMRFVTNLGVRGMLADFSPIPDTPDGERCRQWVDMDEPLMHNKTAFPIILLGFDEVNRLKDLQRKLNRELAKK